MKIEKKCLGERRQQTYHMMREILCAVQDYGAELNVELKRRLMKQCLFGTEIFAGDTGKL